MIRYKYHPPWEKKLEREKKEKLEKEKALEKEKHNDNKHTLSYGEKHDKPKKKDEEEKTEKSFKLKLEHL